MLRPQQVMCHMHRRVAQRRRGPGTRPPRALFSANFETEQPGHDARPAVACPTIFMVSRSALASEHAASIAAARRTAQNRSRLPAPMRATQKLIPSLHAPYGPVETAVGTLAMKLRAAALNTVTVLPL
jgi:hypothetical protein